VSDPLLPPALRRGLFRLDDPLLLERHRAALAALGVRAPERAVLHLDAAGFCPELADALADPFYLARGPLAGHAVVVCAEQLGARLVHPGLGFGRGAFRSVTRGALRAIGALTLREPLLLEFRSDADPVGEPRALADVSALEVRARTPGGLVEGVARLQECQREFLASDRLWLDDGFLRDLAALAERVRDLPPLPEGFAVSRHPLALFFCPAFGGSYVIEEPGASARAATTCVLAGQIGTSGVTAAGPSARGRRVELRRLDAANALALRERHRIARLDPDALRPRAASDARSLPPLERLRLLSPASSRPAVRRFVRHLQAFLDPADLGRAWRDAPDVFFARWLALSPERRAHAACRLAEHDGAPFDEEDPA
jgi:hypothetical protein